MAGHQGATGTRRAAHGRKKRAMPSFHLEQEALASTNYLERLVDPATGFTYFNVFRTTPAEAVHDWPDFLDVPGRSAETCVLLRAMTGRPVATEHAFFRRILGFQEADGLFWRPETRITRHAMHREEQALVMAALIARAVVDDDADAERRLRLLVRGLTAVEEAPGPFPAMLMRPLVRAHEALQTPGALDLARRLAARLMGDPPLFRADGSFAGHVHSHLYAAAGLTELGRIDGDSGLVDAMDRVYRFIRGQATSFGFVPELTERADDVIGCETCCLMDYLHLALALARTGRTEYYDDVERAVRNHLSESRVRHGDWLVEDGPPSDDELVLRSGLRERVVGAYGGWTAPNHMLAYDEWLPDAWVKGPEVASLYLRKVRALQNCCSPSGPKALYLAWQHAAVAEPDGVCVNLLMDRSLPEADIRGCEPFEGRLEVEVRRTGVVRVRTPAFVRPEEVSVTVNGAAAEARTEGHYVASPETHRGDRVAFAYPLPERREEVAIGNAGFQHYRYTVEWRGSTVLRLTPGENAERGRSHLMPEPVALYYGAEGPHPLYQREGLLASPRTQAPLHRTAGPRVW